MDMMLFENIKVAAYLLWEQTRGDNTVKLWYCTEDIGKYLEENKAYENGVIARIISLGAKDDSYVNFVRNIAFRIYVYTGNCDSLINWYSAEQLIRNARWRQAIEAIAKSYSVMNETGLPSIYSEQIRKHYEKILFPPSQT